VAVSTGRCGNYGSATAPGRTAGTSSAGPRPARHAGHKLTPRSPARTTVRRATSQADPKAAATDGHHNLVLSCSVTPRNSSPGGRAAPRPTRGEQVAVAVEDEADRGVPGPGGDLLRGAPAAIQSATAVWRRSWMRSPGRPAARVAGSHTRWRNPLIRSSPAGWHPEHVGIESIDPALTELRP
jgi:hypothetical protein